MQLNLRAHEKSEDRNVSSVRLGQIHVQKELCFVGHLFRLKMCT